MRIERRALHLPATHKTTTLDPAVVREGDRVVDATTGEEIARSTGPIHGLAIDLGTTTVVVRLIDLETGEQVADTSFENPQRFGGSDIMSRIQYDSGHPGRLLMRTVSGYLSHAIAELPADKHPFFVGTQSHPELLSRPLRPHPLFVEFVRAASKRSVK